MTSKSEQKRRQAGQAPETAQETAQNAQEAPSAAKADPGPPPRYPVPPFGAPIGSVGEAIFSTGRRAGLHPISQVRDEVQAISVFRQPPEVHAYKADTLAWLDAMEAYEAKLA